MENFDKAGMDNLLLQLEKGKFINARFRFCRENGQLCLIGTGSSAYVYEMEDTLIPEKHYAAKVIGPGTSVREEQQIIETVQAQHALSEQSEHITRVIDIWRMKLHLDEQGNLMGVTKVSEKDYEDAEGVRIEIILMEKLHPVLLRDKYGNVSLLKPELKTTEGVIKFAFDIGEALSMVHRNCFLHRDIKLENIFWDSEKELYKLGDFGIVKYVGEREAETVVFTDGYGAPEIERKLAQSYSLTADIYSYGMTLFLLFNELKFPASDGYYANPVQYTKDFIVPAPMTAPEKIAGIIRKMCSYRARDRYQSVEEVLHDIREALKEQKKREVSGFAAENDGETEYFSTETETETETEMETEMEAVTETETGQAVTEHDREGKAESGKKEQKDEPSKKYWWNKDESEWTRWDKSQKELYEEREYTKKSAIVLAITAVLSFLLFIAFSSGGLQENQWLLWILSIFVFAEAFLQRIRECEIGFGIFTIVFAGYCIYRMEICAAPLIAIAVVLMGIPALTMGAAIGMLLWLWQTLAGNMVWMSAELGWILLIALYAAVEYAVLLCIDYDKANGREILLYNWMNKSGPALAIAGIVLLLLGKSQVIAIPDSIEKIHLVRVGVGFFLVDLLYDRIDGIL